MVETIACNLYRLTNNFYTNVWITLGKYFRRHWINNYCTWVWRSDRFQNSIKRRENEAEDKSCEEKNKRKTLMLLFVSILTLGLLCVSSLYLFLVLYNNIDNTFSFHHSTSPNARAKYCACVRAWSPIVHLQSRYFFTLRIGRA